MKALLTKAWTWLSTKAWPAVWSARKPLLIVLAVIVAALLAKRLWGVVVDSVLGRVTRPNTWTPISGNPACVTVNGPSGAQVVQLPLDARGKQITSDQVSAVGWTPGYIARVEVKGAPIDRR